MRKWLLTSIIILLIINSSSSQSYENEANFTYIDNTSGKLSDFEGKALLIDTMATWCEPCKIEMAHLYEVNQEVGDQVNILSVSVSPGTDDLNGIIKFKEDVERDQNLLFNWNWGLDQNSEIQKLFNVSNIPTLLLLNDKGVLMKSWVGVTEPSEIISEIDSSINYENTNSSNLLISSLFQNIGFQLFIGAFVLLVIYLKFVPKTNQMNELKENI